MIRDLIRKFKEYSIQKKILLLLSVVLVVLLFMIVAIYSVGLVVRVLAWDKNGNPWYYALNHPLGKSLSLIVCGLFLFLFVSLIFNTSKKNTAGKADERGVHVMDKGTFGSAKWMNETEAKKIYHVTNINNTNETIYGQYTDKGEKVVAYKEPTNGASGNRNTYVLAAPGSGKSFAIVRTEILQAVARGESIIVTDPSGELYTDLSQYCRNQGLDVKVLNVSDPNYSDFWDCLEETIDPETERLDDIRLSNFVSIYMKNAKDDNYDEVQDFWYISANNILQAVIAFTSYEHEQKIIDGYANLYNRIRSSDKEFVAGVNDFENQMKTSNVSFKECRKYLKDVAIKHNFIEEDIDACLEEIHKIADATNPYTIEQVIYNLNNFGQTEAKLALMTTGNQLSWHPAADAYIRFKTNDNDNVRKSAIQGAQMRFKPLSTGKIKNLLSHKGIHISDINTKQSIYFVITSDKPTTTKPIISLFFSFVFTDAQETYDQFQMLAKEKHIENPCLPVSALLDEFFSLGVLCGSAEAFGTVCSTCRKRKIYLTLVTQTYSQLEALYGKHIKDVIQGCCSTFLYLGGNDLTSLKFVSDTSGETTALSESHEETTNILSSEAVRPGYRSTGASRNLLTTQESRRWKNKVLVVRQGEQPLELQMFPWIQHPAYVNKLCEEKSIYSTIVPISKKLNDINKANIEVANKTITSVVKKVRQYDEETGEVISNIEIAKEIKNNAKDDVPTSKEQKSEVKPQGILISLDEFKQADNSLNSKEGADIAVISDKQKINEKLKRHKVSKNKGKAKESASGIDHND